MDRGFTELSEWAPSGKGLRGAITILPILLLSLGFAVFGWTSWQGSVREARVELHAITAIVAASLRESFSALESTLVIAGTRLQEQGALSDPERGRALIDRLLEANPSLVAFGLARPDGQLSLVNGVPAGTALPNLRSSTTTRAGFDAARDAGGRLVIGRTYYMNALGDWVLPIRAAIPAADGTPLAVMTAGLRVSELAVPWAPEIGEFRLGLSTRDGHWQMQRGLLPDATQRGPVGPPLPSALASSLVAQLEAGETIDAEDFPRRGLALLHGQILPRLDQVLWVAADSGLLFDHILHHFRAGLILLIVGAFSIAGLLFGGRTLLRRYDAALLRQAYIDELTGLPNRAIIHDRVGQLINLCQESGWHMAFLLLDIDHFKRLNDAEGHAVGDAVIAQLASRLRAQLPSNVTVARLGGDEFALLFTARDLPAIRNRLAQVLAIIRDPLSTGRGTLHLTASVGVSLYPDDADDAGELYRKADTALNQAKAQGRNRWLLFSPELDERVGREVRLIARLRDALDQDRLTVCFQPVVHARSGVVDSVEVLARWTDDELGEVPPSEFIAIAEQSDQMNRITECVVEHAARALAGLTDGAGRPLGVAINISAVQLADADFARWFGQRCTAAALALDRVLIEVTETALIEVADEALAQIDLLRSAGCQVVLDDFGTGYSSLAYLRRIPLDAIKIDRQFIATVDQPGSIEIQLVRAIVSLAQPLGLPVVAEGIERASQVDVVRDMGVTWLQGYYYARPLDARSLRKWLAEHIERSNGS